MRVARNLAGAAVAVFCLPGIGAAATQTIFVPSDFPQSCATELNSGEALCAPDIEGPPADICSAGVPNLVAKAAEVGVPVCNAQTSIVIDLGADLILLVVDRDSGDGLQQALAPLIRSTESGVRIESTTSLYRNRTGTIVRQTAVIVESSAGSTPIQVLETVAGGESQPGTEEGVLPSRRPRKSVAISAPNERADSRRQRTGWRSATCNWSLAQTTVW